MNPLSAAASGQFAIGGDLKVNRLGFGAMRITGRGIWGEPEDRDEALRTLRRLPELGVNFIDTADSYGREVSERLIHEALSPYKGLVIATKAGLKRPGPGQWTSDARPEALRAGDPVEMCLVSIPRDCPVGDDRGREYRTTNLRTRKSWRLPDSEHSCGGA